MTTTELPDSTAHSGTRRPNRRVQEPGRHTRTHIPHHDGMMSRPPRPETKRNLGSLRREDVYRVIGAAVAGVALTAWLFTQVAAFQGVLPFILIWYIAFLVFFVILLGFDEKRVGIIDRLATVVFHSVAFVLLLALGCVIVFTAISGWAAVSHLNFWTQDLSLAGPLDPLTVGGMLHAAIGTLIMITIALIISIPLGILCAVFLAEFPGTFSRIVRTVVEAMTALPSIICGLFIFATYILLFGLPTSGFAASLAITIMILPIIIRSADVVLRLVPGNLKEASLGLGAGQWRTMWNVVLPTSKSGLTTAIILGTARGIGETSPVLLTAGYTTHYNFNPFSGGMVSLPLATFELVRSPSHTQVDRAFGAALVLMVLVFVLFLLARIIGGRGAGVLSAGGQRRAQGASQRLVSRFTIRARARSAKTTVETTGYGGLGYRLPSAGEGDR